MKTAFKTDYETPSVELVTIETERIFADSGQLGGGDINDFGPGSDNDYEIPF